MKPEPKIATCCYCGTRAALVLTGGRHELSCAGCGAPLHEMKMLREVAKPQKKKAKRPSYGPRDLPLPPKAKKKKKRKSMFSRLLDEAWDAVEDIVD